MEKIITLKYPFEIEKEGIVKNIIELKIRRLKVKDLKKLPSDYFNKAISGLTLNQVTPLIASLNDLEDCDLDQLDIADAMEILKELENFFCIIVVLYIFVSFKT